jgi:hypothetical protein
LKRVFDRVPFEKQIAVDNLNESEVLKYLEYTIGILFAHKELKEMNRMDRVRACYLHASLRYIQNDFMTNSTLRDRFGIDKKNTAIVSRIIKETLKENLISIYDEKVGARARSYIPKWAR